MNKYKFVFIFLFLLFFLGFAKQTFAVTITSDPQYMVMNFSDMNNFDWAVPEDQWQKIIKPKILSQIHDYKNAVPKGSENRRRAWSTLMEYMNFPMDTPSENSVYAIKMRRILEITEEEDLPVFVPLNGFQWLDELPELYNWWDSDGSHTPASFFARQKNPNDFKKRFIKGYNPDNIWNVEWQNYTTPMNLNHRDWGGGDFTLAPPPNLLEHTRSKQTYRNVLEKRYQVILAELVKKLNVWEKEKKSYLFAGMTIGTEVSLNASLTSTDFNPYGYRSIQDLLCPQKNPRCGAQQDWSQTQLQNARKDVVAAYLLDLSRLAVNMGIPKQRIYTHVWGEVQQGEPRYAPYAYAAFNLYSRPGMSFYGFAQDPLALPIWNKALLENGQPAWGAVEYSTDKNYAASIKGATNTFDVQTNPGKIIDMYNWGENKNTPVMQAIDQILTQKPTTIACAIPEIIPITKNPIHDPKSLAWDIVNTKSIFPKEKEYTLYISEGFVATNTAARYSFPISKNEQEVAFPKIEPGLYVWYIEVKGCDGTKTQYSQPQMLTISFPTQVSEITKMLLFIENLWRGIKPL